MTRPFAGPVAPHLPATLGLRSFAAPGPNAAATPDAQADWLHAQMAAAPTEVYWIDKTELAGLLPLCPAGASRILDTHDLHSQRWPSYRQWGVSGVGAVSVAEEQALLRQFDRVICIQAEDHALVSAWLGPERALLAPHAIEAEAQTLRERARSIGFIASRWPANADGIRWFLHTVWPRLVRPGLTLDLYGWICEAIAPLHAATPVPGLVLHGHVADLAAAYAQSDVLINPVRAGAGLKIKTVEALAYGLPLVTTTEGARGLRELDGHALRIADEPQAFADALQTLLASVDARRAMGAAGAAHARRHFTREACYASIGQWLAAGAPATNRNPGGHP